MGTDDTEKTRNKDEESKWLWTSQEQYWNLEDNAFNILREKDFQSRTPRPGNYQLSTRVVFSDIKTELRLHLRDSIQTFLCMVAKYPSESIWEVVVPQALEAIIQIIKENIWIPSVL